MAPCGGTNQFFSFALQTGQIAGFLEEDPYAIFCIDVGNMTAGILYKPCEDVTSSAISNQIFVQEDNGLFQAVAKQQCLKRSPINSSLSLAPCNASDPLEQFTTYADCYPGSYSPGPNQCEPCPAGTFSNSFGATTCDFCPPGNYSQQGATNCTACDLNIAGGCMPYTVKTIYGFEGSSSVANYSVMCNNGTYANGIAVHLNTSSYLVDSLGLYCSDNAAFYLNNDYYSILNNNIASNSDYSGIFAVAGYWRDSMYFYIDGNWQSYGGFDNSSYSNSFYLSICGGNDVIVGFTNVQYDSSSINSFDIVCSTPCPAGRYGASNCDLCPAGNYSVYGSFKCTPCAAGTYSSVIGANSSDACLPCPSGTSSSAQGATSISTCTSCPASTYSNAGADKCTSCVTNNANGCLPYTLYGVHGHESTVSSNATCNAGTYAEAIVIFTDADDASVAGIGVFCSDGLYYDTTFSSSYQNQVAYNTDFSGFTSVAAKAGFYVDSIALQIDGKPIRYGGDGGSPPYRMSCGKEDVIVGFTNVHEDSDQFQYLAGFDIVCGTPCPAGYYFDFGNYSCTLCAVGTYSSSAGQSSCTACPPGTYSKTPGSSSLEACLPCPSGAHRS